MIYRKVEYTDGTRVVYALEPCGKGDTLFFTQVQMTVGQRADGKPVNARGNAPIVAKTIHEAFENIDEAVKDSAQAIRDEAQKKMLQKKLIVPGGA